MNNITLEDISKVLRAHSRFVIISHTNPDGDTVGSVSALASALRSIGAEVLCLCDCDIPQRLSFIADKSYAKDCDLRGDELIISVDVASSQMLGALKDKFADKVSIRIDHHGKGEDFAKFNYVDPSASAAGEIIFDLLASMNLLSIPSSIAGIYAAIASDTGCFRYSNTTAKTHMTAAYLLTLGAPQSEINEALFETVSMESLSIYPMFIENCTSLFDGSVNLVSITNECKKRYGVVDSDLEELSSLSRQVGGAKLGIVIRERDSKDGEFKLSMRSRKPLNCSQIAEYFGGGGHLRAAGATITAPDMEQAKALVIEALHKFIK